MSDINVCSIFSVLIDNIKTGTRDLPRVALCAQPSLLIGYPDVTCGSQLMCLFHTALTYILSTRVTFAAALLYHIGNNSTSRQRKTIHQRVNTRSRSHFVCVCVCSFLCDTECVCSVCCPVCVEMCVYTPGHFLHFSTHTFPDVCVILLDIVYSV